MNSLDLDQNIPQTQLLRITEQFAFEINKKRNSAMLLLDLKKAFDSAFWLIV